MDVRPRDISLASYLDHLRVERGLSESTLEAYGRDLGKLETFAEERGKALLDLRQGDLTEFLGRLREQGLGPRSQARAMFAIRGFYRYGVRNAILPAITAFALGLGGLIGGSTLVEWIFAYPGTGYTLYQAITNLDYSVVQNIANLMIMITATAVLLIDILYPLIDPRITYKKN